MSRNWGIPNTTSRRDVGGLDHPSGSLRADTLRDSKNSFAGATPPRVQPNLAIVVGDRPFLPKRELNPVEELDARLDHRELACCVFWGLFVTFFIGLPLAIAVAIADWS